MSESISAHPRDKNNLVHLYHHEQIPYQSAQRQHQRQMSEPDVWRTTATPATPATTATNGNMSTSPATCDLQDVIFCYQSQPELLRLILLSKVEEDKRRTEEAKLRAKEIDLLLLQQRQQQQQQQPSAMPSPVSAPPSSSSSEQAMQQQHSILDSGFDFQSMSPFQQHQQQQQQPRPRRTSLDAILDSPQPNVPGLLQRRDSPLNSSMAISSTELDEDRPFTPGPGMSLFQMGSYPQASPVVSLKHPIPQYMDQNNSYNPPPPPQQQHLPHTTATTTNTAAAPPPPLASSSPALQQQQPMYHSSPQRFDPYFPHRPRRRREMQAITKIVETREYPYMDGYFWKNNGNTVQKKTGNKSVYYKCSNSTKGCPVNKTVTWKGNGEYLIKYRGEHLPDCSKVQRIVEV